MVQLKSFRYLNADEYDSCQQQQEQEQQQNQYRTPGKNYQRYPPPDGAAINKFLPPNIQQQHAYANISPLEQSVMSHHNAQLIVEGGNLTSSESSGSSDKSIKPTSTTNNATTASVKPTATSQQSNSPVGTNEEDSSTLSSGQELQTAKHILTADEESADEQHAPVKTDIVGAAAGAYNQQQQQLQQVQQPVLIASSNINTFKSDQKQQFNSPMAIVRNQSSPQLYQSAAGAYYGHMSPSIGRHRGFVKTTSADNLSQYSFNAAAAGTRHNMNWPYSNSANQFEIRWRNLNLYATKSKYPRFITDNPISRMFKRNQTTLDKDFSQQRRFDKVYYSPPIKHRPMMNMYGQSSSSGVGINETINEDSELGGPTAQEPSIGRDPYYYNNYYNNNINQQNELFNGSRPNVNTNTTTNNNNQVRSVLNNLSGSVFSGQLTAVLGPSGVGKTMLLNSLTGRNTLDGTGRVSLLGCENCKRMSVVTVPQADVLPEKLTVLEDLQFTSKLKNPQKNFPHARNIQRIVEHLHMKKFLNTRIDKLSGGEARRLSIGRELLNCPDIMILDEPTSGLDANTCKKIITALRDFVEHSENILDRPMSIIVTIHQPQQEVLNLFHRVYVIARSPLGGRAIYEGPPTSLLPSILEHSSLSRVCAVDQLNENPAIVALEVASGEYGPQIINELAFHHENQANEDYSYSNQDFYHHQQQQYHHQQSPYLTPKTLRSPRKSPLSVSPRFELLQRARMNSSSPALDGRQTPVFNKRSMLGGGYQYADHMSSVTSLSYASTYDADLPEINTKLKVDKRLRRSVVMKGDFSSHTMILMKRCWLLTTRDVFLMAMRVIGFLLVAAGTVQIYSGALDKNENLCPSYKSDVDDVISFMTVTKNRLLNLQGTLKQSSSTHLFMFHLMLCLTMVTSALSGLVFPLQMRMFMREYKNGWYSIGSFITSQTIAELPVDIIGPTITMLITYPLCGQPDSPYHLREIGYIVILVLASIITKSQAQIVGAFLMDSIENSVFISCVLVAPASLLSGIAVRISAMYWPLQILSYASHLKYTFEGLLVLRYGYGLCACNPDLVHGYPIQTTEVAVPPQLDKMVRGLLDLYSDQETSAIDTNATLYSMNDDNNQLVNSISTDNENLFVRFIRLVTDASNMFVKDPQQLGDCSQYRSLYLMDMDVKDRIIPQWLSVLVFMFIISRFLTYFAVKLVLRIRRNKRQD